MKIKSKIKIFTIFIAITVCTVAFYANIFANDSKEQFDVEVQDGKLYVNDKLIIENVSDNFYISGDNVYFNVLDWNIYGDPIKRGLFAYNFYDTEPELLLKADEPKSAFEKYRGNEVVLMGCHNGEYLYYVKPAHGPEESVIGIYDINKHKVIKEIDNCTDIYFNDKNVVIITMANYGVAENVPRTLRVMDFNGDNIRTVSNNAIRIKVFDDKLYYVEGDSTTPTFVGNCPKNLMSYNADTGESEFLFGSIPSPEYDPSQFDLHIYPYEYKWAYEYKWLMLNEFHDPINNSAELTIDNTDKLVIYNEANRIRVMLDNKELDFEKAPILYKDRTMVPMRTVFEALGYSVFWDDESKSAEAVKGDSTIKLSVNSNIISCDNVNGHREFEFDVESILFGSMTYVPVRAIAEFSGAEVEWDGETHTVLISEK